LALSALSHFGVSVAPSIIPEQIPTYDSLSYQSASAAPDGLKKSKAHLQLSAFEITPGANIYSESEIS